MGREGNGDTNISLCDRNNLQGPLRLGVIVPNRVPSYGGARGVMVIVVGNGHGDSSSNPGREWLLFI